MSDQKTEPLPMCVEIARSMVDEQISEQHEDNVARIIDAKVRPLVEALRFLVRSVEDAKQDGKPLRTPQQRMALASAAAALKAAGAE